MPAAIEGNTHPGREVQVQLGELSIQLGSWRDQGKAGPVVQGNRIVRD